MKKTSMKKFNIFILLMFFVLCFGLNSETKESIPSETKMEDGIIFKTVNIKGLLISYLTDGCDYEEEGDVVVFEFIPEDGYNGKTIEIVVENNEREKLLKKYFKDSGKLLGEKVEYLKQPVQITATEIYVRPSCGAGKPVYYAKVAKITGIKKTKAVFSGNMEELDKKKYKEGKTVEIKSKKGYAELKSAPSASSDTIEKIKNDDKFQIVNKFGDWYYVYLNPVDVGYIHVDDLK